MVAVSSQGVRRTALTNQRREAIRGDDKGVAGRSVRRNGLGLIGLEVEKVERLVLLKRPADRATIRVVVKSRLREAVAVVFVDVSKESGILVITVKRAMHRVRSALRYEIDDSALIAAVFGAEVVIVVLPVNRKVIGPRALAVHGECRPVRVHVAEPGNYSR